MTIDELIAELQRRREMHGGRTEVLITWESTRAGDRTPGHLSRPIGLRPRPQGRAPAPDRRGFLRLQRGVPASRRRQEQSTARVGRGR
jgi:hypothetical protein